MVVQLPGLSPPGDALEHSAFPRSGAGVFFQMMIDYAHPTMMAERALNELHRAMLKRDYDTALEQALEAATQCRIISVAIRDMAEKELERSKNAHRSTV